MAAELRAFVDIDATPERVWAGLTDLPAHAERNPFVTRAEGSGSWRAPRHPGPTECGAGP
jgi:hypothetical protein